MTTRKEKVTQLPVDWSINCHAFDWPIDKAAFPTERKKTHRTHRSVVNDGLALTSSDNLSYRDKRKKERNRRGSWSMVRLDQLTYTYPIDRFRHTCADVDQQWMIFFSTDRMRSLIDVVWQTIDCLFLAVIRNCTFHVSLCIYRAISLSLLTHRRDEYLSVMGKNHFWSRSSRRQYSFHTMLSVVQRIRWNLDQRFFPLSSNWYCVWNLPAILQSRYHTDIGQ